MDDDKARLLRSLAIDRQAAGAVVGAVSWPRRVLPGAAGATLLLTALLLVLFFLPQLRSQPLVGGRAEQRPAAVVDDQPAAPPASLPLRASAPAGALTASGYVVARRKATVAAEITGKVTQLFVEEGMAVAAGQIIAQLDSVLAESDLTLAQSRAAAAEAAVTAIAADLRDAERIFDRVQTLAQKNVATEADLTKAEARVAVLRAQLGQAQANAQTARLDAQRSARVLDKHLIRAPFGGIVVERSAQPGEMISPMSAGGGFTRTGICTIVDMDSLEIEVDVNEAFIGRVRSGGAIEAALDAYPDWVIPATVIAVVPTANREKATVKVRIGLKEKDVRVLPDMAVKVSFIEDRRPAAGAWAGK